VAIGLRDASFAMLDASISTPSNPSDDAGAWLESVDGCASKDAPNTNQG
jgi:hypothetical protein